MLEEVRRLPEVFGVSREIPLTYQTRPYVDGKLVNSLYRDKHLVVFGGSKQGKTSLRKHNLKPSDYVVVQSGNSMTIGQIYASILKEAGAVIEVSEKSTTRGEKKLRVEFLAAGGLPFIAKAEGKGAAEFSQATDSTSERRHLEIDPSDPNDVIRVLQDMNFKKFIVLEDFHYLSEDVQRQVAMDLKAFHEKSSLCFIVVGVWLESNRLVLYNGDLGGRLIPIEADRWEQADLEAIITSGEQLLNVHFPNDVRWAILSSAQGNVGILQETCYRLCEDQGITHTCEATVDVGSAEEVTAIVQELAREQSGRYQNFLTQFIEGLVKSELEMYRWIAYVIINSSSSDLRRGLKAFEVFTRMQLVHPYRERLRFNNVLQAIKNIGKLQHQKKVQPVILDFDSSANLLRIVDSGFTLFLDSQDKQRLLEAIGLGVLPPRMPDSAFAQANPEETMQGDQGSLIPPAQPS